MNDVFVPTAGNGLRTSDTVIQESMGRKRALFSRFRRIT